MLRAKQGSKQKRRSKTLARYWRCRVVVVTGERHIRGADWPDGGYRATQHRRQS
jgi:hypothetical protein